MFGDEILPLNRKTLCKEEFEDCEIVKENEKLKQEKAELIEWLEDRIRFYANSKTLKTDGVHRTYININDDLINLSNEILQKLKESDE